MATIAVIIDVFRAFTTAAYILEKGPSSYTVAVQQNVIVQLAARCINPLIVGKPEMGMEGELFQVPNSPTRVKKLEIAGRDVFHRTEAGVQGVLYSQEALQADVVLVAGFANASATIHYIKQFQNPHVTFVPMGHRGLTPSLEDDLCAQCLSAFLEGKTFDLKPYKPQLKEGSGSYFFSADQWQYPEKDFKRCLKKDSFSFAIRAEIKGDYALLNRI